MLVLGISAFFHDSAAAITRDGDILAAVQEERLSRVRHDSAFPAGAIMACLKIAGVSANDIDAVVFYDKPLLKFDRLLETYLKAAPRGFVSFQIAMPVWLREKLFLRDLLEKELRKLGFPKGIAEKIRFSNHHLSHAASAFYPSPFEHAAILTADGVGEWSTTSISVGKGKEIVPLMELQFPHSLGLLYSAFTYYCGFQVNSGEYKLMGLAPYGRPIFVDTILNHLIDLKEDGSFQLHMEYFNYETGLTMTNQRFSELFQLEPRKPETPISQHYKDVAASIQKVTEKVMEKLAVQALALADSDCLCLAGGVALNCVANGYLRELGIAKKIWVQPAAGDAGGALGAALAYAYSNHKEERIISGNDAMHNSFLGVGFSNQEVQDALNVQSAAYRVLDFDAICNETVHWLNQGKAVGWFQGAMEFGPRALGNRSILADPRKSDMQLNLNLKIKFRESFRPFAPSVLLDKVSDWFECDGRDPYMLFTSQVRADKRDLLPAITHVDGSARVQTVDAKQNFKFHQLLSSFDKETGCPVLINTSFNLRGEPIVCTPTDAYNCFMSNELDVLVLENCILLKSDQPSGNYRKPKIQAD